jgi:hypothetical protein
VVRAAWVIVAVLGCNKDEGGGTTATSGTEATGTKPSSPARSALLDAWKKGGFEPSALSTTKAFGDNCQSGTINKVEVLICEFPNAADAKAAEKPGFDWVGETTGAAWVSGPLVIAVADRKKADPSGKTINSLMKLTPK